MRIVAFAFAALAAIVCVAPAEAAQLSFTTTLAGNQYPTTTGSAATGSARIVVDTTTQTIDATITITGLKFADLRQHLAHSRMGPIHLHRYQGADVTLIVPFPMGATYVETANGFTVTVRGYRYADGAAALNSNLSFAAFVAALGSDPIYLNVHTERFGDGEISGRVRPAT